MRVLAGHGRLAALRKSNVTDVPVLMADLDDERAAAFTIADNKLHDTSKFDLGDLGSLIGNMSAELSLLTGFNDDELAKLAALQDELADVGNVAINARKGTLYAGDDNSGLKAAMNDRTLVIVFETEAQMATVRGIIRKLQQGNEKSTGQVVLEVFSAHTMPKITEQPSAMRQAMANEVSKSQDKRLQAQGKSKRK